MKEMTVEQLTQVIESVKDAVDASGFGPVYELQDRAGVITKVVSPLGFQVYQVALTAFLSNPDKIMLIPTAKKSDFSQN